MPQATLPVCRSFGEHRHQFGNDRGPTRLLLIGPTMSTTLSKSVGRDRPGGVTGLTAAVAAAPQRLPRDVVRKRRRGSGGAVGHVRPGTGWADRGAGPIPWQENARNSPPCSANSGCRASACAPTHRLRQTLHRPAPAGSCPCRCRPPACWSRRFFSWARPAECPGGNSCTAPRGGATTDTSLASFIGGPFQTGRIVNYGPRSVCRGASMAGDAEKLSARLLLSPSVGSLERTHGFAAARLPRRCPGTGAAAPRSGHRNRPRHFVRPRHAGPSRMPLAAGAARRGGCRPMRPVTNVIPGRPWKIIWTLEGKAQTSEFDARGGWPCPAGGPGATGLRHAFGRALARVAGPSAEARP